MNFFVHTDPTLGVTGAKLAQARNNDFDNFRLVFERLFVATIIDRMDANDEIFQKILGDDTFKELLLEWYARQVFNKATKSSKGKS